MARSFPDREGIIWAAGLFEGEGCFTSFRNGSKHYAGATLVMKDEDVIRRLRDVIGFGSVLYRPSTDPRHAPVFVWRTYGFEKVQALVAMLFPWLGERRRARAIEVLGKHGESFVRP